MAVHNAAVRDALGPGIALEVDAVQTFNHPWSLKQGVGLLERLAPDDVAWTEEVLPSRDPNLYAELRRRTPIPISGGRGIHHRHRIRAVGAGRDLRSCTARCHHHRRTGGGAASFEDDLGMPITHTRFETCTETRLPATSISVASSYGEETRSLTQDSSNSEHHGRPRPYCVLQEPICERLFG